MSTPDWKDIDIEPTHRARALPDGRLMRESRLTIPKEWMEEMWQGYRCAACLQRFESAYPNLCFICEFPVKREQRRRLEQDFVEQVEEAKREGWIEREQGFLERKFFEPKPQIHVRRSI